MNPPVATPPRLVPPIAPAPPRRRPSEARVRIRRRLAGALYLLLPLALIWLSLAVYHRDFETSDRVTVESGTAGNEMHPQADVKLRGVVVGRVERIDTRGSGARLTLALQPGVLRRVPSDVTAQLLPTTLFGQRYVALVPPARPSGRPLRPGAVIPPDRSRNAVELQQALNNLLPLLTAVRPDRLSATLTAVSQALDGRGTQLGATLTRLDGYLRKLNPELPHLNADIREFVEVSRSYEESLPGIVDALYDATTTSATLADQRPRLAALTTSVTASAQSLDSWLRGNRANLIRLTATGRPTLELLSRYAPAFPCTLKTLADFVPAMDRALGKGTARPGLHVDVTVLPGRGAYRPGTDRPRYEATGGPACYPVPYGGPAAASPSTPATVTTPQGGLGIPNSPQENTLVNEILRAGSASGAAALPDWSSLLAGPVLRGTEVRLK
ncbi:MCE family protein [Streptomyces lichenis]|uniref:MCE family protein n=1 Tax=Streptomyces lichenis TaxID=2306967 RepID=A0ABT0IH65_9ACTN|nr:MCE family protein [Streptomyces lichenis]MCK8680641.1 MCE family protein [Streptomyces lichenis]